MHAFIIDYLPSDSQMGAKVFAVGLQRIHDALFGTEDHHVLSRNIHCCDFAARDFVGTGGHVPAIGVGWEGAADILKLLVVVALDPEDHAIEDEAVEDVDGEGDGYLGEGGELDIAVE